MSERGLVLALQRLHDDPGFVDLVSRDPDSTLGIYDLDEAECKVLIEAVTKKDDATLREMANKVGVDWAADHIQGVGALSSSEVQLEGGPRVQPSTADDLKVTAFGADWVTGSMNSDDTSPDVSEDPSGLPIKRAGG
ncbi:MAG: hypothetical protein ABI670_14530 [Chloroflexota bacterium]